MKLINQSTELVIQDNPFKCIELAGRVSHKSEERITDTSHKDFIIQMLKLGHTATLEFGSVYLETTSASHFLMHYDATDFIANSNSYKHIVSTIYGYKIYTNLRVLLDECPALFMDFVNNSLSYCNEFTPDSDDPYTRYTFKIVCNRGVSHELVRHRVFSFLQESTRYCNYSKDKFSNELNIIIPDWMTDFDIPVLNKESIRKLENCDEDSIQWNKAITVVEEQYNILTGDCHLKAQEARGILPNDLKTELYMCGFLKDWIGHNVEEYTIRIFGQNINVTRRIGFDTLRRDKAAHPQAREIANQIFDILISIVGSDTWKEIKEAYYH